MEDTFIPFNFFLAFEWFKKGSLKVYENLVCFFFLNLVYNGSLH